MKTALLARHVLPERFFMPIRHVVFVLLFIPFTIHAESGSAWSDGGPVTSNVPLNEVSVRAYRFFHKQWPAITNEAWYKTDKEFIVTFSKAGHRKKVFF